MNLVPGLSDKLNLDSRINHSDSELVYYTQSRRNAVQVEYHSVQASACEPAEYGWM